LKRLHQLKCWNSSARAAEFRISKEWRAVWLHVTNLCFSRSFPLANHHGAMDNPDSHETGSMKTLLIVYHTMTGGTRQMAEAAAEGARSGKELEVLLTDASQATTEQVLLADGYIFATPENLAAISGAMKSFFDRTYYNVLDQIVSKPYAIMVCAGSDGQNAVRQIQRIATGWRLKEVAIPLVVCTHAQTPERILQPKIIAADDLQHCHELGATLAAGIAMGIY
jgi:multimeric flavodoxin WrbA